MKDLLFFDIEVYYRNAFVVFKDIHDRTLKVFHNDFSGLYDFIEGKTLVGYNNYFYDDVVLHAMIDQHSPKQIKALSDRIIGGERVKIGNYKFDSLDCFQQIDPTSPSLKKIQANLGVMILESSVPFTIERELSEEEYLDVLRYCEYDVSTTIKIYKMREQNYFVPKESIIQMLDNPYAERWNTTTLSANVLLKRPVNRWHNIKIPEPILDLVPSDVADMWITKEKGSVTIHDFGCEIVFGFGGLHGQNSKKKRFENVINLDVASLYPSIIVNHNILGVATKKYKEILEERIRIKHTDPQKQEGLKLILNSVFGLLKSEHSLLWNPKASTTVCGIGQAIIYELAKRLSHVAEIVQINTDGVAFIPYSDDYKEIAEAWQKEYSYTLEQDIFEKFYQRDVNNYIAVTPSGKIKTKGGDVNRFHEDMIFKNNNARIVDKCIVNKLVYGRDVLDTLLENLDDPKLFQYILRAGPSYLGTYDQDDNKYERFNRVFASKDGEFCLYKKRKDNGLVRFADAPMKMYLHNGDCSELTDFDKIVDLNHYYQLIMKKLEKWQ